MIYTQVSSFLLLSVGLASVTTAYSPHVHEARMVEVYPRQFGKGKFGGGFGGGNNGANNANTGANNANAGGNNANTGANNANANANNANNATADAATGNNNGGNNGGAASASDLALDPNNVQDASDTTGQAADSEAGQADSATDPANFINFCTGKTLTNGLQVKGGSCNGIVMGDIPSSANMVSSIITNPLPGDDIAANQDFNITVQTANLQAGSFTNPDNTYYAAPQALSGSGQIIGHTHVTVQDLGGSLTPTAAPDAGTFAFFKGINDAGNGQGLLSATVAGGLPAGSYRVCTMSSASNHQPVLMPVAQRGAQDDCTKFTVGGNGAANAGNANGGNAAQGGQQQGGQGGQGGNGNKARRSWSA